MEPIQTDPDEYELGDFAPGAVEKLLEAIQPEMELIQTCEEGKYFRRSGKVIFLSNQDMEVDLIVKSIKSRFDSEWPTRWEEIKASIPEGPFPFKVSQDGRKDSLIRDLADTLLLTKADWLRMGMGDDHADNLITEAGKSKLQPLNKVIFSLGIIHIGRENAKMLADRFKSLDKLGRATWKEIILTPGISATIGTSILDYFHSEDSWRNMEKLRLAGCDYAFGYQDPKEEPKERPPSKSITFIPGTIAFPAERPNPIKGKTFMFTGRLECYTRHLAQEKVESLGGKAGSSVTSNTDYLVVGESPGSKLGKAIALGIKRLSEGEFLELLKEATNGY